jgi:hypothetical protein
MIDPNWITAGVAVAGMASTLYGVHLTNGAAERRRKSDSEHEDLTRFHSDRAKVYTALLAASRNARAAAYANFTAFHGLAGLDGAVARFSLGLDEVITALAAVELVASERVRQGAQLVSSRATAILQHDGSAQKLNELSGECIAAEKAFIATVRDELLPAMCRYENR